jgi:hypothetical protein
MTACSYFKKKPMASVRQVPLFQREIKERVNPAGFELLLNAAKRISEGQINPTGQYFGSTIITMDILQAVHLVRDACDVATAAKLAQLLQNEAKLLNQVRQLAIADAKKIARQPLDQLETECHIRTEKNHIFIDIDVEGKAVSSVWLVAAK